MSKRQNLMAAPAKRHDGRGNCVDEVTIYGCRECGKDNICDVCHHVKAKGPPCVVCGKPVSKRAVTRCPWCRRVLCFKCNCPGKCATKKEKVRWRTEGGAHGE